ncbi:MAG: hypothetical protein GXP63_00280 [DPANN group archaeon]|nr:hypothetical protein [DPANN group archaeon]
MSIIALAGCQPVSVGTPECPPGQVCIPADQAKDMGIVGGNANQTAPVDSGVTKVDMDVLLNNGSAGGDLENTTEQGALETSPVEETSEENKTGETQPGEQPQEMLPAEETGQEQAPAPAGPPSAEVPVKTYDEGDLVSFPNLKATDPDGDKVTFTFSPPLDAQGTWQTKRGDAGKYRVTITASDGVNEVSKDVDLVILPVNAPPILEGVEDVIVDEGQTVSFNPVVTDPDEDDITITYSGWMTSSEKKTGYGDAGTYDVTVTASDGIHDVSKTVTVTVMDVNRAPTIDAVDYMPVVTEGDTVSLVVNASDLDGDALETTFAPPLDKDGRWVTQVGDAGDYELTITVSDGKVSVIKKVPLTVKAYNNPPVISGLEDMTVKEGDTIVLQPTVSDADGDQVSISYSGWMTSSTYTTTYDDAGTHSVTVTADDGKASVSKTITITVEDVNRPPVFEI